MKSTLGPGARMNNDEHGENAGDRGDSHCHVESCELLKTALLQDTAKQGHGEERTRRAGPRC